MKLDLPMPRVRRHRTSCAVFDPTPGSCDCGSPPKIYDADELRRYGEQVAKAARAAGVTVPIPPGECTAPNCDCEPGVCLQLMPATFTPGAPPAYEVVYFRRRPGGPEDCLRVPLGTAKQHIREELIARIVPADGVAPCETCNGEGTIDERLGGYSFSNPAATCPDCTGEGPADATTSREPQQEKQ